jgi:hypothetical protein
VDVSYVQWHFILEEIVVAGQGETIHLQWRNILHHFGHCKADTEKFWRLVYQASWMLLGCMTCLLFDAFVLPTLFTVHWGRQREEVATKEQGVRLLKLAAFGLHPRGDVMFGEGDQFTCNQESHCVNWSLWNCKAFGDFGEAVETHKDWSFVPWAGKIVSVYVILLHLKSTCEWIIQLSSVWFLLTRGIVEHWHNNMKGSNS